MRLASSSNYADFFFEDLYAIAFIVYTCMHLCCCCLSLVEKRLSTFLYFLKFFLKMHSNDRFPHISSLIFHNLITLIVFRLSRTWFKLFQLPLSLSKFLSILWTYLRLRRIRMSLRPRNVPVEDVQRIQKSLWRQSSAVKGAIRDAASRVLEHVRSRETFLLEQV